MRPDGMALPPGPRPANEQRTKQSWTAADGKSGVSPVVATILLVAITIILAVVLWQLVLGVTRNTQEVPPKVALSMSAIRGNEYEFLITVDRPVPIGQYELKLWADGQADNASTFSPLSPGSVGNLTFEDTDGANTFSSGDLILVQTAPGRMYELVVVWQDSVAGRVQWQS